ncbi:N-acetylmuramoyl-L-alanine amidase [Brevundimonas vesicularis]|uniref:N-acetylmuramoyl-L-alanine amidase n=1 Tax=Brevundimonas vesicularis TaxID=41276 RepID=UPI0038D429D6
MRKDLKRWGVREWATAAATVALVASVVLTAGRGLAFGSDGGISNIRFGGDAQRTRVVLDMGKTTRGQVVEDGTTGRVIVSLSDVSPRQALDGSGSGLVRSYQVSASGNNSRVQLDLARGAEIERRFLLPPADGVSHYRYVIDLKTTGAPAAARPATARREQVRKEKPLIVIDAGHGGRDPGAQGQAAQEKTITLAAAKDLKEALERIGRYRVRLTRSTDVYLIHGRRVQIARDAGADLFISLHADAGSEPSLRGASVYTLSEQGAGRAVREFTRNDDWQRELRLPGRDPSVDRILLDLTQRATQNRSAQFARILLTHLEGDNHPLLRRSHRDGGLAVLLAPDVPAILLEMGFVTNPDDEAVLTNERSRKRLMRSVAEGIDRYFREPSAPVRMALGSEPNG